MYVTMTCLRDALYKTINLSVFTTVHTGYRRRVWRRGIHFSCGLHCGFYQRAESFVDPLRLDVKLLKGRLTIMVSCFWKPDEEKLQRTEVT